MTAAPAPVASRRPPIVIIGGGITGLSAALALESRADLPPALVLEAGDRPGGCLRTTRRDGLVLEHGADSLVRTKPAALELAERLGISGEMTGLREPGVPPLVLRRGKLVPLPSGLRYFVPGDPKALLTSPAISLRGRLRALADVVLPAGASAWLDDEPLDSFVRRRFGSELLAGIAQPLAAGIWPGEPSSLSMETLLPRLRRLERNHGSIIRSLLRERRRAAPPAAGEPRGNFLSPAGGMERLAEAASKSLERGRIRCGVRATGLTRSASGGWEVSTSAGPIAAAAVLLALPAPAAARLAAVPAPELSAALAAVPGSDAATLNLVYREQDVPPLPAGSGFLVPAREGRALLACTFMHRKYPGRAPDGVVLLRAFAGPAAVAAHGGDGEAVIGALRQELETLLGISAPPVDTLLTPYEQVLPVFETGHAARRLRIEWAAGAAGRLAVAGNYLTGVGISDCIESAGRAARRIAALLSD